MTTSSSGSPVVLLARRRLFPRSVDHVQALLDLGFEIHLVTSSGDAVPGDPRFASTTALADGLGRADVTRIVAETARRLGTVVITFTELDIVIAGEANELLGVPWARPEADRIGRDKRRQRKFLLENGIPSVWHFPVYDVGAAAAAARDHGFPVIVKPTRAASSIGVQLVEDEASLAAALASLRGIAAAGVSGFADGSSGAWALIEEFVPGREVTLDGVVLGGEFILGAIHDKLLTAGPFFEEDLYTLPFSAPEREQELAGIATQIVKCLGLDLALFNAELREDSHGNFRVVEFSPRISGGHVYRNIRDVYGIDLVKAFTTAACRDARARPPERLTPRMATCAKLLYADGRVRRNSVGNAIFSPNFRAYYPMARPGEVIACAPRGFDILGALSVWLPWWPGQVPSRAHRVALNVAAELDVVVSAD
jgi:carbamoylphosphate synthase large subunit